jgi:hypothetical protein
MGRSRHPDFQRIRGIRVYYTGHGALLPTSFLGTDDDDKRDEAIVPYECATDALILDNWIADFLRQRVSKDAFFYGIYDCCHSGELYKRAVIPGLEQDSVIKELDFSRLYYSGIPDRMGFKKTGGAKVFALTTDPGLSNSVHFGASEPGQTALVLSIDGVKRSVFTWALEQVVKEEMSIEDLGIQISAKQTEQTSHHKPYVACNEESKKRKFLT